MTKQMKNKIVTVAAILLLAVAVVLTVQLFIGEDKTEPETQTVPITVANTMPATEYNEPVTQKDESEETSETSASVKYLWDYGPGKSGAKTAEQG